VGLLRNRAPPAVGGDQVMRRFSSSLIAAAAAFVVGFVIENVVYIEWAVREYPHNNSMAGLAAFAYGIPVGGLCAGVVFCLVFFKGRLQGDVAIVFRRYVVRVGLPVGAVIGLLPLIYGVTWSVEWEILIARLAIWLVICGGIAFGLGWLLHVTVRRDP
jgi:hypothetical protein